MNPKMFVKRFDRVCWLESVVYTCVRVVIVIPEIGRVGKGGSMLQQLSFSCESWSDSDPEDS